MGYEQFLAPDDSLVAKFHQRWSGKMSLEGNALASEVVQVFERYDRNNANKTQLAS